MSRVVMFVLNDVSRDSRVLKEAAALASAGHGVTIVGLLPAESTLPRREALDGFEIVRVPFPVGRDWWRPHPRFFTLLWQRLHRRRTRVIAALCRRGRASLWALRGPRAAVRTARRRVHPAKSLIAETAAAPLLVPPVASPGRAPAAVARARRRPAPPALRAHGPAPRTRGALRLLYRAAVTFEAKSRVLLAPDRPAGVRLAVWLARLPLGCVAASWATLYIGINLITLGNVDWLFRLRYRWMRWGRAAAIAAGPADAWHAHDLNTLPAALAGQEMFGGPLVYDSHEVFLESGAYVRHPRWTRRVLRRFERRWVARCSTLVTVNGLIEAELDARYAPGNVVVVHNCSPRPQLSDRPARDILRLRAGLPPATPIALYHGSLVDGRGIEQLAEALLEPGLENVHAILLGYGGRRAEYVALAAEPRFAGRLHVLDAVAPADLVDSIRSATLAVMPIQPSTLNHRLSTPNKLFEALAAGLPIVGPDFQGFRRIVLENPAGPLGVLCDPRSPEAIAEAMRHVLELPRGDLAAMRSRCLAAARETWNWEIESGRLVSLYRDLLREPARTAVRPAIAVSAEPAA